jgi:hypothetical protein
MVAAQYGHEDACALLAAHGHVEDANEYGQVRLARTRVGRSYAADAFFARVRRQNIHILVFAHARA